MLFSRGRHYPFTLFANPFLKLVENTGSENADCELPFSISQHPDLSLKSGGFAGAKHA